MNQKQQVSRRHHFVPQFYLRTWYESGKGGFWLYSRNAKGEVGFRRSVAKSIAYDWDLYSFQPDGLNPSGVVSDEIETSFFRPIDDAASLVHRKLLISGVNSLSGNDRYIWALFMNSLIERSPKRIQELLLASDTMSEPLRDKLETRPISHEAQVAIRTALDKIDMGAFFRNTVLSELVRFIYDKTFIEYVSQMAWQTIDLPYGLDHFLTSDSPVIINGGTRNHPIYILSIALSPKRLLVMHKPSSDFDSDVTGIISFGHNVVVTQQAERHLVSSRKLSDSRFIKYTRIVSEALGVKRKQVAMPE